MDVFIVLTIISFILRICESNGTNLNPVRWDTSNTDSYLNTIQIIKKHGYPAESHVVETDDGYLLELIRIPHGKYGNHSSSGVKRPPVFLHHGLLGSSADYFLLGSENALPFLLSNLGFDIWLGNVRGNVYSRAHVTLFPNHNRKFWNFTWHESAIHDVPAQINFICNHTKHEKIVYIGFSMGTTVFFVMTSTLPQYNDKIELSLLMAPVAYLDHIKSPILRYLTPISEDIEIIAELITGGEFLPDSKLFKLLSHIFCERYNIEKRLCTSAIFLLVGCDPKEFDTSLLQIILSHYPEGYSAKALNHYSQLVTSGKFRQYDYGPKGNLKEYGTPSPPDYDVSLINTPLYMYVGKNDYLSVLQDVQRLAKQLSNVMRLRVVDYPKFSHLDFLASIDVKHLVYDVLIDDLMSHLTEENDVPV